MAMMNFYRCCECRFTRDAVLTSIFALSGIQNKWPFPVEENDSSVGCHAWVGIIRGVCGVKGHAQRLDKGPVCSAQIWD